MDIITKFTIWRTEGATIFNTTIYDDLKDIILERDKEGFEGCPLSVGTTFTIPEGEYAIEGKFKVINIHTFIWDKLLENGDYHYNYEVNYEVQEI